LNRFEVRRNAYPVPHHYVCVVPHHWAVQTLGYAVVGGRSKQNEGHKSIWITRDCLRIDLCGNEIIFMSGRNWNFFLIILLLPGCGQTRKEKTAPETSAASFPSFPMTLTTGEQMMTDKLPGNVILIFYNPGCDHCQREAAAIRKDIDAFRKYSLFFIAADSMDTIRQFAADYDLAGQPNVVFATATVSDVSREMGPMGTPSLFIYESDKKLVKKFDGETKVEEIAKFLKKTE
jgi:peroxiredoxin